MKFAIFGGTFDPIHLGHLLMAESARVQYGLDHICFLPTGRPPHKKSPVASPQHRLAMVRQAIRGNPAFEVSDWEIRQNRTVYTFETLAHFKKRYPKAQLFFILGSDSLRALSSWRQGTALLRQAQFLAIDRAQTPWHSLPMSVRRQAARVDSPLCALASHSIRALVARKKSIRYQVSPGVESYIRKNHLYKGKKY